MRGNVDIGAVKRWIAVVAAALIVLAFVGWLLVADDRNGLLGGGS